VQSFSEADRPTIEALRRQIDALGEACTLEAAAQRFAALFAETFESVVLSRVFLVAPFSALPPAEQAVAAEGAVPAPSPSTPVLSLLSTCGKLPEWNDRTASAAHRAIPLVSSRRVAAAPMIARLLSDLDVDLGALDEGRPIATRQMLGGKNGTFYVEDARDSKDAEGREVISSRDFAEQHGVRTVFGMGGAYVDGTLVVAIFFCSEKLDRAVVDRFPLLIGTFKTATTRLVGQRALFEAPKLLRKSQY
jgi:hypothetical protein